MDDAGTLQGEFPVVWDTARATHLLVGTAEDRWFLVDVGAHGVQVDTAVPVDLSRSCGTVRLQQAKPVAEVAVSGEQVRSLAAALAAAEAAGVARWSLRTAVEHAKVREQFGRVIGAFQAVKHLCAEMLERAESATAVAWDAAAAQG